MQHGSAISLAPTFPDVLGLFSGGVRLTLDAVECALGIYPHGAAVGQPFEALILLQSACDQPVQLKLTLQLPRRTTTGERLSLFAPRDMFDMTLPSGEVGLLHFPIVAQIPTPVGSDYGLSVRIAVNRPRNAKMIRNGFAGRMPGTLPISKHRKAILQHEVDFRADTDETTPANTLHATFNVLPGQVNAKQELTPHYDVLWTAQTLSQDQEAYAAMETRARSIANTLTRTQIYEVLQVETKRRFEAAHTPLHPGEVLEIAKLLSYTLEDGVETEASLKLSDTQWLQRLTLFLDDDAVLNDVAQLMARLYTAVIHDAVLIGYALLAPSFKVEDEERTAKAHLPARPPLGLPADHEAQGQRLAQLLDRQQPIPLEEVYLPLVLAGLAQHVQIKGMINGKAENLWTGLAEIRDAWRLRQESKAVRSPTMIKLTSELMQSTEDSLVFSHVPRA